MKKNLLILATALMSVMHSPSQADVSTGLIAYYPFNGNANDASGNGHNGIVNGATLAGDRYENLQGAYLFDGIDDFITIPNHTSLNPEHITISLWIKILTGPICQTNHYFNDLTCQPTSFVSKSSGDNNTGYIFPYMGYVGSVPDSFGLIVNTVGNYSWDMNRSLSYSSLQNPNLWHLYTATYDGAVRKVYVDGLLVSQDSQDSPGPILPNPNDLTIGTQPGFEEWAHAVMDDIRIYDRALSADEVSALAILDKDQCKNDGWTLYGFDNQGQCIQFVNTGK